MCKKIISVMDNGTVEVRRYGRTLKALIKIDGEDECILCDAEGDVIRLVGEVNKYLVKNGNNEISMNSFMNS